jgi:hypothetical protein
VRHREKYLDMPVSEAQAFVFTHNGEPGPRAQSLKDFIKLLVRLPEFQLEGHIHRHDFSRWIDRVFRDCPLATHVRSLESHVGADSTRNVSDDIAQAIRARYEMSEAG